MTTTRGSSSEQYRCSFCSKERDQVKRLIAGPGANICDECVDLCRRIVDEQREPVVAFSAPLAEPRFTHSAEAVSVELWPGVIRKTLGWGDRALVAEITLYKGSVVPEHSHPHEQVGYVASGRLEFIVGSTRDVLVAGDGYIIPGNLPHSVIAHEDSIAIDIFSPVRDEYKS